jgi:phenylacetate-CoA ligase
LTGRSFDVIRAPNGRYVPGVFWTITSREVPGIDAFQVQQVSDHDLAITVVAGEGYDGTESLAAFERRIIEEMGHDIRIEFTTVDRIPPSPAGKRRFVLSSLRATD